MKLKGAIFDVDGTLLDSMFIWDTLGIDYLISLGKTPEPGLQERLRPMSMDQVIKLFLDEYGVERTAEEIRSDIEKIIERYYFEVVEAKPGALEFLAWVKQQGIRTCVVTASVRYVVEAALERTGLMPYLDTIFICDEFGKAKNEPDIFLHAMDWLGTDLEHTWVFEDVFLAVQTAKRAGFGVVAIYDKTSANRSEEIAALADRYVQDFVGLETFFAD